jgi:hypothetical protein
VSVTIGAPLADAVGRVRSRVHEVLHALSPDELATQPGPGANPIGWLVWHLTRVQDGHVSEMLDEPQLYLSAGFADALGLPADPTDSGYGHTPEQVAAVRIEDVDALLAYHDAVADRSAVVLGGIDAVELDRVVDEAWDPPVTAAVRWVSIVSDCLQHVGQAAYVRGLLGR